MIALSKTPHLTQEQMSKRCNSRVYYIDARSAVFGRLSSTVAFLLQNKLDPSQSDHHLSFSKVVVYNLVDVVLTGKKERDIWTFPSTYAVKSLMFSREERLLAKIFRHAVMGMLPKNRLRRRMITHLFLNHRSITDDISLCQKLYVMKQCVLVKGESLV